MPLLVTCIALGLVIAGTVYWFVLRRPSIHSANDYRAVVSATEDRHSARNEAIAPEMRQRLERDLRLACEHLDSIQILIQVAATHHQSVPPSVVTNLKFVSRHLRSLEQQVGDEHKQDFNHRDLTFPPDIRKDAEYHASPFDRSALSG
jgi:hypothetical protein